MFRIYADEKLIWTPKDNDRKVLNPKVTLEVNKVGSASFSILPNHIYYDNLVKMKTIISIIQEERTIFKGRVYSTSNDFRNIKTVEVEGVLGYLNDSVVRPYSFSGSPTEYFSYLINQHNSHVEPCQRFKVGRVTVKDNNNYITRASSDCPTTWSEITSKLIDLMGGYISIRYEVDGNYIDYLADYEDTATQDIAFRVNLLDISLDTSGETLSTCILPYGATLEGGDTKVDIKSVNGGIDYICDEEAVKKYGRIYEVVTWDDVTLPSNLLTKAKAYLATKVKLNTQITVKAIDLHLSDEEIQGFKLGDYVRVYSRPHNIDDCVLITSYDMDLADPSNCTITLNMEKSSFVEYTNKNKDKRVDRVVQNVGDIVTNKVNELKPAISEEVITSSQGYITEQVEKAVDEAFREGKEGMVYQSGDFNSILTTGKYIVKDNAWTEDIVNLPAKYAGSLYVISILDPNVTIISVGEIQHLLQIYMTYNACIYIRSVNSTNETINYGEWKQIV